MGVDVLVVAPHDRLAADLAGGGYRVTSASTGAAAVRLLDRSRIDLVVVDRDTPDLAIVGRERFPWRPPVLCVTACEHIDELMPELGSRIEDYVTKPCRRAELLARARVLVRDVLRHRDLVLDDVARRAWRGDRALELSPAEYRLLRHLLRNAGRVLSKAQLAEHLWGEWRDDNTIERLVSRLRSKVDRGEPALIRTQRGFGYRLSA